MRVLVAQEFHHIDMTALAGRRLRAGRSLNTVPCALQIRSHPRAGWSRTCTSRAEDRALPSRSSPTALEQLRVVRHQRKRDKAPTGVTFQESDWLNSPRVAESTE